MTKSIITSLSTVLLACSFAYAESATPPNVVLILSDDQGYTDYGFMGHLKIETPHLDKLALGKCVVSARVCSDSVVPSFAADADHRSLFTSEQDDRKRSEVHSSKQTTR